MLTMVEPYMLLKEKMATCFDNLASIESHSSRLAMNKSQQHWDDFVRGMLGKYKKYTFWWDSRWRFIKNVQILIFEKHELDLLTLSEKHL